MSQWSAMRWFHTKAAAAPLLEEEDFFPHLKIRDSNKIICRSCMELNSGFVMNFDVIRKEFGETQSEGQRLKKKIIKNPA